MYAYAVQMVYARNLRASTYLLDNKPSHAMADKNDGTLAVVSDDAVHSKEYSHVPLTGAVFLR